MSDEVSLSIGPYQVEGTIAKGSSATVLKAIDSRSGQPVVVKVSGPRFRGRPATAERLLIDARAAAPLSHSNLVRVLDTGMHGEDAYIVMELVPAPSLDKLLGKRRLTLNETLIVVKGIARALAHVHQAGLVHGNVKPRNVLVSEDFKIIKLTDLGTGKMESAKAETGTLATGQVSVGTVHYSSPELAHGTGAVDARSDIYSLGVLFYEMLTGRAPTGRINLPSQLVAGLPTELDPIVLHSLAQDRNQRQASIAQLLADIERLEEQQGVRMAAELEGLERTTRRLLGSSPDNEGGKPKTGLLIGGIVALLVVLGLLVFLLLGKDKAPAPPAPEPVAAPPGAQASAETSADLDLAQSRLDGRHFEEAGLLAQGFAASNAASPLLPRARLIEAQALAGAGKVDEARRLLGEIASQYPASAQALPALVQKAALEEKKKSYQRDPQLGGSVPAALVTYRTIAEAFPTAKPAEDALWRLGELYADADKHELAVQAFTALAARFPQTGYEAWFAAAKLYDRKLKDPAKARQAYAQVPARSSHYRDAQERLKKL